MMMRILEVLLVLFVTSGSLFLLSVACGAVVAILKDRLRLKAKPFPGAKVYRNTGTTAKPIWKPIADVVSWEGPKIVEGEQRLRRFTCSACGMVWVEAAILDLCPECGECVQAGTRERWGVENRWRRF